MGISVGTTLLTRRSQVRQDYLVSHLAFTGSALPHHLGMLASKLTCFEIDTVDANHRALAMFYKELQRQAQMLSYLDVFVVLMTGSLLRFLQWAVFVKSSALPRARAVVSPRGGAQLPDLNQDNGVVWKY